MLRALNDWRFWYSVCVAEPESLLDKNEQDALCDVQAVESEPPNFLP